MIQEWPVILAGISTFLAIKIGIILAAGEVALGLTRAEAIRVALLLSTGGEFAFVIFKLASVRATPAPPLRRRRAAAAPPAAQPAAQPAAPPAAPLLRHRCTISLPPP